jgi:two-component system sensor histidine kinase TctE
MKEIPSIQVNLIKFLTIPLILSAIFICTIVYFIIVQKVTSFYDNRLLASVKSIEQNIGILNGNIVVDLPSFSIEFLVNNEEGYIYYSVLNEKKELLIGHKHLLEKKYLNTNKISFYNKIYDGNELRVITYKNSITNAGKNNNYYITIGETNEERNKNINQALILLLTIIAIIMFFTISITIFAVKKGLSPLYKLQKIVENRDERDLESLKFDAPEELKVVVNSINILLNRSRNTIDYIEQFNSDVSHQLRTPLAELKVKLEFLFKKDSLDYISLNSLLNNMTHITEQLLLYAKTNPNTIKLTRFKKVNLNEICKEYAIKIAPRVYSKGFELAFEGLDEQIFINSDVILLESMLDNLINNSLHYAVDNKGNPIGTITLSLKRHNNTIWLNVKDEGISKMKKEDLHKIFERFYRVDSNKSGSGLGLSIVKQIATLHNAKVLASMDNGFIVSIIFENKIIKN